jgi:hypothetical protein
MAKKKKAGPPYDISESACLYILISWAWGVNNDSPSERTQDDIDRLGSYIEAAIGYLPIRVFTRKTVSRTLFACYAVEAF